MNENKWIKHDRPEGSTIPISWYNDICVAGLTFSAQIIAYNCRGNGTYTVRVGIMDRYFDNEWDYRYHEDPVSILADAIRIALANRDKIISEVV